MLQSVYTRMCGCVFLYGFYVNDYVVFLPQQFCDKRNNLKKRLNIFLEKYPPKSQKLARDNTYLVYHVIRILRERARDVSRIRWPRPIFQALKQKRPHE